MRDLTITEVANVLGKEVHNVRRVPASALRWRRTAGGHRRYSKQAIVDYINVETDRNQKERDQLKAAQKQVELIENAFRVLEVDG